MHHRIHCEERGKHLRQGIAYPSPPIKSSTRMRTSAGSVGSFTRNTPISELDLDLDAMSADDRDHAAAVRDALNRVSALDRATHAAAVGTETIASTQDGRPRVGSGAFGSGERPLMAVPGPDHPYDPGPARASQVSRPGKQWRGLKVAGLGSAADFGSISGRPRSPSILRSRGKSSSSFAMWSWRLSSCILEVIELRMRLATSGLSPWQTL